MTLGKLGAIAVVAGVLAVQLFALSPAGRGGWYWPFVDYPMYSAAKQPGATFGLFELEAVGCDGDVRVLSNTDLQMPPFRYRNMLEVAAGGRPDRRREAHEIPAARERLAENVEHQVPGDWCAARVQGRIYTIGEDGLDTAGVRRRLLAEWRLDDDPEQR